MSQSLTCLQIGISTPDTQQIWRPTDTTVCQSQRPIDNIISVIDLPINLSKLFDLKTKIRWNAKFHCKNRFNHVPVLRKASNSDWGLQYHLTFIVKHFFAQTRSNNHEVWVTDFLRKLGEGTKGSQTLRPTPPITMPINEIYNPNSMCSNLWCCHLVLVKHLVHWKAYLSMACTSSGKRMTFTSNPDARNACTYCCNNTPNSHHYRLLFIGEKPEDQI
jgi:hypothetical protein